jgi:hypothetical protein
MEKAGCEALFVGTGGVVGDYTGLADVGTATMTECVTIAGWIADSVSIPVIMEGDTGHGGIIAVRRMVQECRGQAKDPERRRRGRAARPGDCTPRAAVDMKNELDPSFVVMAQCEEIKATRPAVTGPFSFMKGKLGRYLDLDVFAPASQESASMTSRSSRRHAPRGSRSSTLPGGGARAIGMPAVGGGRARAATRRAVPCTIASMATKSSR